MYSSSTTPGPHIEATISQIPRLNMERGLFIQCQALLANSTGTSWATTSWTGVGRRLVCALSASFGQQAHLHFLNLFCSSASVKSLLVRRLGLCWCPFGIWDLVFTPVAEVALEEECLTHSHTSGLPEETDLGLRAGFLSGSHRGESGYGGDVRE